MPAPIAFAERNPGIALLACAAVLAILLVLPVLMTGVPAYLHDWTWPPDAAGLRRQLFQGWEPWVDDGLGGPNPYPTALPYFVVLGWLAAAVPSGALLGLLLLATFTLAFAGAALFAQRVYGHGLWAALACGALYAASPLALTKLVAGHVSYLQAYAAFPFFALALVEAARDRRWLALGALALGASGIQPQLVGFEVLWAGAWVVAGAVRLRDAAAIAALGLPMLLPLLIGPTVNAGGGDGLLAHQRAVVAWERAQSAPLLPPLIGLGYFTHYFSKLAEPLTLPGLILVPAFAAFELARSLRRSRAARALLGCAVLGWCIVTGLDGPLAAPAAWIFQHLTPASVFRELFDAMVLLWLPLCVLAAAALRRVPPLAAAAAVVIATAALLPPWIGYERFFWRAPAPETLAAASALARESPAALPGRVVWWPALQPMGPAVSGYGGTDPLARTGLAGATALYEYQPDGTFGTAVALARRGEWDAAAGLWAWLGVDYLVARDGIASFPNGVAETTPAPHGSRLVRLGSTGALAVYRLAAARPLLSAEPVVPGADPALTAYQASRVETDPAPGRLVAAFPYVWRSPAIAACGAAAVIGDGRALAGAGGPWILAAPVDGERCTWRTARSLAAGGSAFFVAAGYAPRPQAREPLPAAPVAVPSSLRVGPGRWDARLSTARPALLVVRTGFDRRLRADVDGRDLGAPALWNGFPSWPLTPGDHQVSVRYGGAAPVYLALAIALAGFAVAIVLALRPPPRAA